MGKSIRSKVMKRFRTCKRQVVAATIDMDRLNTVSIKTSMIAKGQHLEVKTPVNGFKYPKNVDSDIPKVIRAKSIDFRSQAMPNAGYAVCRNRRKKNTTVVVPSNAMEM